MTLYSLHDQEQARAAAAHAGRLAIEHALHTTPVPAATHLAAQSVRCKYCAATPPARCTSGGNHFARYAKAWMAGYIGGRDMATVILAAGAMFTAGQIIPAAAA